MSGWENPSNAIGSIVVGPRASGDTTGATDGAAIQAAIEANPGKTIWLVDSDYYSNGPGVGLGITLDQAGTTLMGSGRNSTTIHRTGGANVIGVTADNVEVSDLSIDGGLSGFPALADHGISAQNVNHFRADRVHVYNYKNTAILAQGTPSRTYSDNVIENCTADGGGVSNNGFLVVNLDYSGIRQCYAHDIPGSPGYGCQVKNDSRFCFIEDCVAANCVGGLCFGRDSSPGVSSSRIVGGNAISCGGGILAGDASDNVIDGVQITHTTNTNDLIRFQQACTNNLVKAVHLKSTGAASRVCVRFDDTCSDNVVELELVDCDTAATAIFNNTTDRNTVWVGQYGSSKPSHEVAGTGTTTGTANRVYRKQDRRTLYDAALGAVTQSFDRALPTAALAMASQLPYYIPVYLEAGEIVSNVTLHVSALTVAPTNFFVGLYTAAGARVAVSADVAASVTSTGQKTLPLTAPYTVLDSGVYYVALLNNGGTLSPLGLAGSTAARLGANPYPYAQDTNAASTTLPTPNLSLAAGTKAFWVEVS